MEQTTLLILLCNFVLVKCILFFLSTTEYFRGWRDIIFVLWTVYIGQLFNTPGALYNIYKYMKKTSFQSSCQSNKQLLYYN